MNDDRIHPGRALRRCSGRCTASAWLLPHVSVSIQSYALAPLILATTDDVCTLPSRFLSQFEDRLDLFEPPVELSALRLVLAWHPRVHRDASHQWLRRQLYLSAQLEPS